MNNKHVAPVACKCFPPLFPQFELPFIRLKRVSFSMPIPFLCGISASWTESPVSGFRGKRRQTREQTVAPDRCPDSLPRRLTARDPHRPAVTAEGRRAGSRRSVGWRRPAPADLGTSVTSAPAGTQSRRAAHPRTLRLTSRHSSNDTRHRALSEEPGRR